jgi:SpoVK/Ycf46/Vps4 family AAA+-type ATPase
MADKKLTMPQRLASYYRAGYPMLYLLTSEENRAELEIVQSLQESVTKEPDGRETAARDTLVVWSATEGSYKPGSKDKPITDHAQPLNFMKYLAGFELKGHVFILRDFHPNLNNVLVLRYLRDISKRFQALRNTIIMLSPVNRIPPELHRDIVLVDFELPDRNTIGQLWDRLCEGNKKKLASRNVVIQEDEREKIISAAMGLSTQEATNAFALAMVESLTYGGSIADRVLTEKAVAVKKSGILEYFPTTTSLNDIGGLEIFKQWAARRSKAFTKKAREYGLPTPKGVVVVGAPGGGKSLGAKATSSIMGVPLIRFDVGRVFGGVVGQSEQQAREATSQIDAIGPCVVWIDEMEKAFAGASGGGGDSGTTKRVFGHILTWLQEKETPSFVIATVNSLSSIPPEMIRKGRFDENFFFPLPGKKARVEILNIHQRKMGRAKLKWDLEAVAEVTKQFSGAELESVIRDSLFLAFDQDREPTTDDLLLCAKNTNPLAKSRKEDIDTMVSWAKDNAVTASLPDEETAQELADVRQLAI